MKPPTHEEIDSAMNKIVADPKGLSKKRPQSLMPIVEEAMSLVRTLRKHDGRVRADHVICVLGRVREFINENSEWLRTETERNLRENTGAHPEVIAHWKKLAGVENSQSEQAAKPGEAEEKR